MLCILIPHCLSCFTPYWCAHIFMLTLDSCRCRWPSAMNNHDPKENTSGHGDGVNRCTEGTRWANTQCKIAFWNLKSNKFYVMTLYSKLSLIHFFLLFLFSNTEWRKSKKEQVKWNDDPLTCLINLFSKFKLRVKFFSANHV